MCYGYRCLWFCLFCSGMGRERMRKHDPLHRVRSYHSCSSSLFSVVGFIAADNSHAKHIERTQFILNESTSGKPQIEEVSGLLVSAHQQINHNSNDLYCCTKLTEEFQVLVLQIRSSASYRRCDSGALALQPAQHLSPRISSSESLLLKKSYSDHIKFQQRHLFPVVAFPACPIKPW